jgi:hypothetical protein
MTRLRLDRRTASSFAQYLSAFAPKFLHTSADHSKIVGGARPEPLAAQLLHACPDHRKIVGGAGSGHVPSIFLRSWCDYPSAAIGSMRLGSLFLPGAEAA